MPRAAKRRPATSPAKPPSPAPLTLYDRWLRIHAKFPQVLYHYTTAQGLLGILQSGRLWATNSRFLNDPTEIVYATQLFRRVAQEEFDKYRRSRPSHVQKWKDWINAWLDEYEQSAKVYVACFCANGDLLSQWRGYGATGGGYAVGFSTGHLPHSPRFTEDIGKFRLRRVIYNSNTQEGLIRECVKALCNLRSSAPDPFSWFSSFFSESLNCFKHPAFAEEQEWRAIQFGRRDGRNIPDLKFVFRTNGSRIMDYSLLDLHCSRGAYAGRLPIRFVRYGPTLDPKTTERSLQILLGAHGYDARLVDITRSGVPFTG